MVLIEISVPSRDVKNCAAINKEKSFKNVKTASFRTENWRFWSGLRDLNPRSPGPKPGAIPNFAKPGYSVEDFAVVVKYVVKEILPHFRGTFKSGDWGKLGRNRGVRNISDSRTNLVFQLPNDVRCSMGQRLRRGTASHNSRLYTIYWKKQLFFPVWVRLRFSCAGPAARGFCFTNLQIPAIISQKRIFAEESP